MFSDGRSSPSAVGTCFSRVRTRADTKLLSMIVKFVGRIPASLSAASPRLLIVTSCPSCSNAVIRMSLGDIFPATSSATTQAVELVRKAQRDWHVNFNGEKYQVGATYIGTAVTLRLDGHLMHAIAGGALAGTWPCPVTAERAARMNGARTASTPLPPPPLPAGSIAARRRVHPDGRIMVNKQMMKLGPRHAGKLVTVIIEDTCYRILHGEEELAVKPRKDTSPITRLYVRGMKTQT